MSMEANLPPGYSLVPGTDVSSKVSPGDLLWDEGSFEWVRAEDPDLGHEVYGFNGVARIVGTER